MTPQLVCPNCGSDNVTEEDCGASVVCEDCHTWENRSEFEEAAREAAENSGVSECEVTSWYD